MKHLKKNLTVIVLFSFVLLVSACSKDDDSNTKDNGTSGTFTAKINGTDYNPEFVNGYIIAFNTSISISGSESSGNNVVVSFPIDAGAGDTFTVDGLEFIASYDSSNGDAVIASEGSITITAHDTVAQTVSGTFSFVGKPLVNGGTTYTVTAGSFSSSYVSLDD